MTCGEPDARRLNREKDRQPKGGDIMAKLNNGKLIDGRYHSGEEIIISIPKGYSDRKSVV